MPVFDTLIYDEHKANTADVMQAVNGLVRLPKSRNRHNVAPSLVAPMMLSDTMNYSRNLIPTSKVDLERAKAAIEAGYPAVEPILGIWRDASAGRKLSAFPFHQPQSQDRDTEFNDFFLTADKSFGKILTYFGESV